MRVKLNDSTLALLLALIVALSRLPFLFAGLGADEDAWQVALNVKQIAASGVYDVSRLPGCPVQDYLLLLSSPFPAWTFNIWAMLFTAVTTISWFFIFKKLELKYSWLLSLAIPLTPVVYIASTNSMDYAIALGFASLSILLLLQEKYIYAGITFGLAIGSRITGGALLLPMAILALEKRNFRPFVVFGCITTLVALISFIPVLARYGLDFFRYYAPPENADIAKVLYKALPGVWGFIGSIGLAIFFVLATLHQLKNKKKLPQPRFLTASAIAVLVYFFAFFRLPQEAGYLIPIVPFVIGSFALLVSEKVQPYIAFSLVLSSFSFGIAKKDNYGGPNSSPLATTVNISNQVTLFDPLYGPIIQEHQKRINRIYFTEKILNKATELKQASVIISGWWLSEILFDLEGKDSLGMAKFTHYPDISTLKSYKNKGFSIYYLPEQEKYCDLTNRTDSTNFYSKPFPLD